MPCTFPFWLCNSGSWFLLLLSWIIASLSPSLSSICLLACCACPSPSPSPFPLQKPQKLARRVRGDFESKEHRPAAIGSIETPRTLISHIKGPQGEESPLLPPTDSREGNGRAQAPHPPSPPKGTHRVHRQKQHVTQLLEKEKKGGGEKEKKGDDAALIIKQPIRSPPLNGERPLPLTPSPFAVLPPSSAAPCPALPWLN